MRLNILKTEPEPSVQRYTIVFCIRKGGSLVFKCQWCNKYHYHGIGNGTRASHCSKHTEDYEVIEVNEVKP